MRVNSVSRQQSGFSELTWFGRNRLVICRTCVLLLLLFADRSGLAERAELTPQPGVLIMRSGHVLHGDIIRVGNRYVLTTANGDELRVPVDRVEFRSSSLEAAYAMKKQALPDSCSAAEHLELGDWCLHYGLMSAAAEQLMAAQNLSPDAPENARFEKRLRLVAHQPEDRPQPVSVPENKLRSPELNQVTDQLSTDVVRQFTAAIQPLLMNRCSANACHGGQSDNSLKLIRPLTGRTIPRHFTQRNLQAVLAKIDRNEPWKSPLLVLPTVASDHGHIRVFTQGDYEQLQLLASWVERVTGYRGESRSRPGRAASASTPAAGSQFTASPAISPTVAERDPSTPADRPVNRTAAIPQSPLRAVKTPSEEPTAQDPFDPEIFNRRYLRR